MRCEHTCCFFFDTCICEGCRDKGKDIYQLRLENDENKIVTYKHIGDIRKILERKKKR